MLGEQPSQRLNKKTEPSLYLEKVGEENCVFPKEKESDLTLLTGF